MLTHQAEELKIHAERLTDGQMITTERIKEVATQLQLDITDECAELLASEIPPVIAVGSSGGKDSSAQAILLDQFLKKIDYSGTRVIIHADLGRIEHVESIGHVRALADFIKWPLIITRREKGDLLDRYEQRWRDNCRRYALLECVTLIGPFPAVHNGRFCTSELKVAPILQTLSKQFSARTVVSCVGLRAEESTERAAKPIFRQNLKFTRRTRGYDWHPIHSTMVERVFLIHKQSGFPLHPQYSRGNSRLSCSACFIASENDLRTGASVTTNHFAFRFIMDIEIRSSFSYQANKWLADIAPQLLTTEQRQAVTRAKAKATERRLADSLLNPALLFRNHGGRRGWPDSQPSLDQCANLAKARNTIARLFGTEIERITQVKIQCLDAKSIYDRYEELIANRPARFTEPSFHYAHPVQQLSLPA